MAIYTPPAGDAADFALEAYTPPAGDAANFELGDTGSTIPYVIMQHMQIAGGLM
jgi:hypothetical protein